MLQLSSVPARSPGPVPAGWLGWDGCRAGPPWWQVPSLTRSVLCPSQALYMFYALAIVCDDFFVPSLEKICEVCVRERLGTPGQSLRGGWGDQGPVAPQRQAEKDSGHEDCQTSRSGSPHSETPRLGWWVASPPRLGST